MSEENSSIPVLTIEGPLRDLQAVAARHHVRCVTVRGASGLEVARLIFDAVTENNAALSQLMLWVGAGVAASEAAKRVAKNGEAVVKSLRSIIEDLIAATKALRQASNADADYAILVADEVLLSRDMSTEEQERFIANLEATLAALGKQASSDDLPK